MTTTQIMTWAQLPSTIARHATVEGDVAEMLATADGAMVPDDSHAFRQQLAAAWRDKINACLPDGVSLHGDTFYADVELIDSRDACISAAASVDVWAIVRDMLGD